MLMSDDRPRLLSRKELRSCTPIGTPNADDRAPENFHGQACGNGPPDRTEYSIRYHDQSTCTVPLQSPAFVLSLNDLLLSPPVHTFAACHFAVYRMLDFGVIAGVGYAVGWGCLIAASLLKEKKPPAPPANAPKKKD